VKRKLRELMDKLAKKAGYLTVTEAEKLVIEQREKCAVRASHRFQHAKSNRDMFGAVINTWLVTEKHD
jgi:hypothetical protein